MLANKLIVVYSSLPTGSRCPHHEAYCSETWSNVVEYVRICFFVCRGTKDRYATYINNIEPIVAAISRIYCPLVFVFLPSLQNTHVWGRVVMGGKIVNVITQEYCLNSCTSIILFTSLLTSIEYVILLSM